MFEQRIMRLTSIRKLFGFGSLSPRVRYIAQVVNIDQLRSPADVLNWFQVVQGESVCDEGCCVRWVLGASKPHDVPPNLTLWPQFQSALLLVRDSGHHEPSVARTRQSPSDIWYSGSQIAVPSIDKVLQAERQNTFPRWPNRSKIKIDSK